MRDANSGSVQLLKVDPELARGLDAPRAREAAERLYTRAIDVPRGRWTPQPWLTGGSQPIGLLVLEGLLVREATVSDHPCAELLGPGDLLRAWDDSEGEVLLPRTIEWTAATSARVAIIDQALAVRMAQWPEIFAALMDRAARRAERLVVMQAIAHLTRVDDRLLALLWLPRRALGPRRARRRARLAAAAAPDARRHGRRPPPVGHHRARPADGPRGDRAPPRRRVDPARHPAERGAHRDRRRRPLRAAARRG